MIYFKYADMSVEAKAKAEAVRQYADLTPKKIKCMSTRYANQHRFVEQDTEIRCHIQSAMNKKYCILI